MRRHQTVALLALTVGFHLLTPEVHAQGGLQSWQRLELEASGKVDRELLAALEAGERVRVIATLQVGAGDDRVLQKFVTAADRQALRREGESVLGSLPAGLFDLAHQYRSIDALAGETGAEGVLALAALSSVDGVGLDERLSYSLAEATRVAGINPVRRMGKHGKGIWVALLDSGVDTDHPDLRRRIKAQECFCSPDCCPNGEARQSGRGAAEDDVGHGTGVGGSIVGMGRVAATGAARRANLIALKIGSGQGPLSSDAIAALDWILNERPDVGVYNMSFGGGGYRGNCDRRGATSRAYARAIDQLRDAGILGFAASGNGARPNKMVRPACIANAIAVGAVYDADFGTIDLSSCTDETTGPNQLICFTDRNRRIDLLAPGALLEVPDLGGTVSFSAGTSLSSPLAAGCAVLLRRKYPEATVDEIEAALEASSVRATDPVNGRTYPALNCQDSFSFLNGG